MGLRNSSVLCLAVVLALSSSIQGMDIVKSLSEYPELAKFSEYLVQTKLADQINSMKAVTAFGVNEAGLAPLAGKSVDVIKAAIGAQVIPDFYDEKKLIQAQGGHDKIPTVAGSGMYVGLIGEGEVAFSSGANNDKYDSKLVTSVLNDGSSLSVFQITSLLDVPSSAASSKAAPSTGEATPSPKASTPAPSSSKPAASSTAAAPVAEETMPVAVGGGAPAPAPSSGSRAAVMGLVGGAAMALASLFINL